MKRRTLLASVAGMPVLGSSAFFASAGSGAQAAATPAPVSPIDPRRAALLVLDYQLAWIATLAGSDALLDRAARAIAVARDAAMQVAYARVAFTPADYAAVPPGNVIFTQIASPPGALDDDAPRTAIDARVAPMPGDKVVRKTRVSAFERTDLDAWLRALGIDTLILAGISTSGVVLSTVCDGADRDYRLVVVADACADTDPEIQDVLIGKVFPQRAEVIAVADLAGALAPAT